MQSQYGLSKKQRRADQPVASFWRNKELDTISISTPPLGVQVSYWAALKWVPALLLGVLISLWMATPAAAQSAPLFNQALAMGNAHACAITSSGGVQCWGSNGGGVLGIGNPSAFKTSTPVNVLGLTDVIAIDSYSTTMCALTGSGGVKCWGSNNWGQVGNGSTAAVSSPVDVTGLTSGVVGIAVGSNHACAVLSSGSMKCWGAGGNGQLGDGVGSGFFTTPVDVVGVTDAIAADAGETHTCAVRSGGGVKCWGNNTNGRLGNGSTTSSTSPVDVVGLSDATMLVAAVDYTCAVTGSGAALCWGQNNALQGGVAPASSAQTTPLTVDGLGSGVAAISAHTNHTCALLTSGGVTCWGYALNGILGTGRFTAVWNQSLPVDVYNLSSDVIDIAAGYYASCAMLSDGTVKCWGWDQSFSYQLGQSSSAIDGYQFVPVPMDVAGVAGSGGALSPSGLSISKSLPNPYPPVAGEPVVYTIVVTNTGSANLTNVTVTDEPSPSLTMTGFTSSPAGTCNTGTLQCTLNSALAPGAAATFEVTFDTSPTVGDVISNTAYVTADLSPLWTYPTAPAPLTPSVATGGGTTATDLAITKSADVTQATTGSPIVYTLTVVNNGPNDATNVVATDLLPAGFTFNSASATGGGSCSESGGTVTCTWPTVTNGTTVTATINVTS